MDLTSTLTLLPALALLVAVTGCMLLYSRRDPVTLLTILLACLLLISARWVLGPLGGVGTPAVLIGLFALCWWLAATAVPSLGLVRGVQPARWIILGYAWFLALGYVMAYTRPLTSLEVSGSDREMIILAAMCGVALLAADGIHTRERLDTLLRRLVWLTTIFASFGILQFLFGFDIVSQVNIPGLSLNRELFTMGERSIFNRPGSTALHPIEFSVVLCMMLPLALHYALDDTDHRRRRVFWACAALIAGAIPMSLSRTGILGLLTAIIFLLAAWSWKRRIQGALVGFVFGCVLYVTIPGLLGTIKSLFLRAGTDPSVTARQDRAPAVMELWSERFWLGRGAGTYSVEDYFLLDNQYFVTAIEHGLVGVAVLVGFLVAGIWLATVPRRHGADPVMVHLGQALAAPLAVVLVSLATFDALFYRILTMLMFLFIGCAGALWRMDRQRRESRLQGGPEALAADLNDGAGNSLPYRQP